MPSARSFNQQARDGEQATAAHQPALERAYRGAIIELGRLATRNFRRLAAPALVAAGEGEPGDPPQFVPVDLDELFTTEEGAAILELRTRGARDRMVNAATGPWADELEPAVRNRITGEILLSLGARITEVTDHVRQHAGVVIRQGLDEGWSIDRTSKALRSSFREFAGPRATLISRTEMIGAANAGSLAVAKTTGAMPYKRWLATLDSRTRPTHAEANGQVVAIDQPFYVGGATLQHPGAQGAPADEVCNCRCTVVYQEDAMTASAAAAEKIREGIDGLPTSITMTNGFLRFVAPGQFAPAPPAEEPADGEEPADPNAPPKKKQPPVAPGQTSFEALLAPIGTPTDDGRILDPAEEGAIAPRDLPLTLMAMFETSEWGHTGAVIAGRIDAVTTGPAAAGEWSGTGFLGTGVFDDGPDAPEDAPGREAARLAANGMLSGVSVDLAPEEIELRTADNEPIDENDEEQVLLALFGGGLMAVTRGSIMGATMTPFPAFSEANVTVVASLEHRHALLAAAGVQEAIPPAPPAPVAELVTLEAIPAAAAPSLTRDQAEAYAALVAGGIVAVNDVRSWLGLAAAHGGHVLRETIRPVYPAPAPAVDPNQVIAASLAALAAREPATSEPTTVVIEAAADRPARKLRIVRDADGVATGYEEVASDG